MDLSLKPSSTKSTNYAQHIHYISQNPVYSMNISDLGEDGHLVSDFIKHQGDNPPLQRIDLSGHSMHLENTIEFLQFISRCKYLTPIDLSNTSLDEAASYLAESIKSWGENPPLQKLDLHSCSLSVTASLELVQSLSSCKYLTELDLRGNKLGEAGHQRVQSIRSWRGDPTLQELYLYNCSLSATASLELVKSLSTCRNLIRLNLGENKLREAGNQLAQSIRSWGDEPPLQELCLHNCSLTASASLELVQSLSRCTHLTELSLGENKVGEAGYQLAQLIRSFKDEQSLKELYLQNCSLPAAVSLEIVKALATYSHLTLLDLRENKLDEGGHQLAQSIKSWGAELPLQNLLLNDCSLTATASLELVQSLSTCHHLIRVNIRGNKLREAGHQLAQSIKSWGDEPPLQNLLLDDCSLTATASIELVQSLATCRHLTALDLRENKLGEAGHQLAQSIRSWGDEPPLQELWLYNCSLTGTASLELVQSLSTCRNLTAWDLGRTNLAQAGKQLAYSIRYWGDEPPLQKLYLDNCSLPATASLELVQSLSTCRHLSMLAGEMNCHYRIFGSTIVHFQLLHHLNLYNLCHPDDTLLSFN